MNDAATLPVPDRFALLLVELRDVVAARWGWIGRALTVLILERIARLGARFTAMAAKAGVSKAGVADAGVAKAARATGRDPEQAGRRPEGRAARMLPCGAAWLVSLVPAARDQGSRLADLLADPEMAALVADCPGLGRVLRPLCRMLGVNAPDWVRRERAAREPQSADEVRIAEEARRLRRRRRRREPVGALRSGALRGGTLRGGTHPLAGVPRTGGVADA